MKTPSKRSQLIAHLKLCDVLLASVPRKLNMTPTEADRLIASMERDGLIEIKRYPKSLDKHGKCDRLVLKQQEQKAA